MSESSELIENISRNNNNNIIDHLHFMTICLLTAQRSKDPVTQVGACIVDRNGNLMGTGYNGMPRGCDNNKFPWGKESTDPLKNKKFYVCHAELNAITNTKGNINDCTLYVTLFPCNECAKLIIQNGISEVVYLSDKYAEKKKFQASKLMFDSSGVKYWQFKMDPTYQICIDLEKNQVTTK